MATFESPYCPECDEAFDFPAPEPALGRRAFLLAAAGGAVAAMSARAKEPAPAAARAARPAEDLIRELFASLKADQKAKVVLPYDHGAGKGKRPTRQGMYNEPIGKVRIKEVYTKAQADLIERIVKAMSSGDDGYRLLSRDGGWDNSGSLDNCGAVIFGDASAKGKKFAFVFAGHHLTIRCDGDSEPGAAFGGPIYYGHSPDGYSKENLFQFQTQSVIEAYKALDGKQREKAVVKMGTPGEQDASVRLKKRDEDRPGLPLAELSKDQKALVEKVMRDVLSPYRKEDVDEVMAIVKSTGGVDKIRLAYYPDGRKAKKDEEPWSFWRLEGPGFVWNYRVLPHVHTFVNIATA